MRGRRGGPAIDDHLCEALAVMDGVAECEFGGFGAAIVDGSHSHAAVYLDGSVAHLAIASLA